MDTAAYLWSGRRGELPGENGDEPADGGIASEDSEWRTGRADKSDTLAAAAEAQRLIGVQDSWKPSWSALGVPSRTFVLPPQGHPGSAAGENGSRHEKAPPQNGSAVAAEAPLGLRLQQRVSSSGGLTCSAISELNPSAAAALAGLACGDILLELNGQIQLGLSARSVEIALARAWGSGTECTIEVVPAMQARVLTRASPEIASAATDDATQSAAPEPEVTERVVVGIFRIPLFASKATAVSGRPTVLGRLLGLSPPSRRRTASPQGLTAQTARAYILQQTIRMLNARDPTDSTSLIQLWLTHIRPELVKEFGEGLIDANSEFLLELLSNHVTNPSGASGSVAAAAAVNDASSAGDASQQPDAAEVSRTSSGESSAPDYPFGADPQSAVYVYRDTAGKDGQRQLDAALAAAQAAWAAEKRRRRAVEQTSSQLPLLVGSGQAHDGMSISVNEASDGGEATESMQDGIAALSAARAGRTPGSPSSTAKAAARAHRAALEKHAKDSLAAAEEAWAAEKKRHEAKQAKVAENLGLQHNRALGGRVVQRQRTALLEPSADPEPNRPWFGGGTVGDQ